MEAMASDGNFLFDSVEPGKRNQCNFIHPKHVIEEAEQFLDKVFDHLLTTYGAEYCRNLFGGHGHVRREKLV